jgi:AcrR family transcriptional regulator
VADTATSKRGPKPSISREQLIESGLDLINAEGFGALNLRALAKRLGISAMTPYGYFKDKAELLAAMVDHALAPLGAPADDGLSWDAELEQRMRGFHEAFDAHPGILDLLMAHPETQQLDAFRVELMERLQLAGLSEQQAGDALRALTAYVIGYAAINRLRRTPSSSRHSADPFERGLELMMSSLRRQAT